MKISHEVISWYILNMHVLLNTPQRLHVTPERYMVKIGVYESYVLYLITMINKITMIKKITLVIIMVIMEIMVIIKIIIN